MPTTDPRHIPLAVYGPNLPSSAPAAFLVHDPDCADCRKGLYRSHQPMIMDAGSATEVCDAVYPPEDFQCESGEYLYDFHFYPCVKFEAEA